MSPPNEAAFYSCGGQHRTILGKSEISLLAENAYTSAGASGTFIIVNEYFTSVTLTSSGVANHHEHLETTVRLQRVIIFHIHSFLAGKLMLIFG